MKCLKLRLLGCCLAIFLTLAGGAQGAYPRRTPVVEAFDKNKNAVVNISSKYIVQQQRNPFYSFGFEDFFAPRELSSLGSGFVLDPRGYIVTNAHVVNHATEITAIFWSDSEDEQGNQYEAKLIAIDAEKDIALLKINRDAPFAAVELGISSDLMIGETALAIGNPLGYQHTLTEGVVSAIHRDLEFSRDMTLGDLIQVSTPINPGNSGGPLLNINGQVIGVNTAISQAAQGIGFAIPVDQLKRHLPKILALDSLRRIDFGVQVDSENLNAGATINHVLPGSQAEQVGLEVGDRIETINGEKIDSALGFSLEMLEQKQGEHVALTISRGNRLRELAMTMNKRPQPQGDQLASQIFGLGLAVVTEPMARKYDIPGEVGDLVVLDVDEGSSAHSEGIKVGDILVAVGGRKFQGFDQLGLELEDVRQDQMVRLTFNRTKQYGWSRRILQFEIDLRAKTDASASEPSSGTLEL